MTDNDIIKALECCCNHPTCRACFKCPLEMKDDCTHNLQKYSLALINRQKAEIERLEHKQNKEYAIISDIISQAKAEAIKEFAERLKEQVYIKKDKGLYFEKIDNLVKEMVGDPTTCKTCKHLMFSDMYGECAKAHKGIVNPDDTCPYAEPKEEKTDAN